MQHEPVIGQLGSHVPQEQKVYRWQMQEQQSRTERLFECWVTLSTKLGMNKRWQIQQQGEIQQVHAAQVLERLTLADVSVGDGCDI